jgi:hypothetical protein
LTLTTAGDATEVDTGATLGLTATPDVTLNNHYYTLAWSVDDETKGTVVDTEDLTNTLTGVAAGTVVVTCEIKEVDYTGGSRTLISLDPVIKDTASITVNAAE